MDDAWFIQQRGASKWIRYEAAGSNGRTREEALQVLKALKGRVRLRAINIQTSEILMVEGNDR